VTGPIDASTVAAALADHARRAAFAAVVLGAGTLDAVAASSGLSREQASKALARLVTFGLVTEGDAGLQVAARAMGDAARSARQRPASPEHDDAPSGHRAVMRAFVRDGRLTSIPTQHSKRMVILDWLVQDFEPGRRYTEAMVNMILGQRHADTAALRRYLVDNDFLDRAEGMYWRCGGTIR
jgi:hypothetical protein